MSKDSRAFLEAFHQQLPHYLDGIPHAESGRRGITFEPHQQDELRAVQGRVRHVLDEHRHQSMMALSVVAPCGSGKTLTEMAVILASQRARQQLDTDVLEEERTPHRNIVVTSGRAEAIGIRDQYRDLGYDTGRLGGGEKPNGERIVIANIQALQAMVTQNTLEQFLANGRVDTAVMDEADLHMTEKRKDIKKKLGAHLIMGATATESWPDGRDIADFYGEPVYRMDAMEGIRRRINARPLYKVYEAAIDGSKLRIKRDDYDPVILSGAMKAAEIHKSIAEVYRDNVPEGEEKNMPTLIYVPSVALVRQVRDTMQELLGDGLRVVGWSGEDTDVDQLREHIELFKSGDVNVAVMCMMGGRGMNLENAQFLIDAFPTLSLNTLQQRQWRVLRRIRKESPLWRKGWRKQNALIAQILPRSNRFRPALMTDVLGGWESFQRLQRELDMEGGRPEDQADRIDQLRQFIERKKPTVSVELLHDLNIYEQIQRFDELPQADASGFFYLERSQAEKLRNQQRASRQEGTQDAGTEED